MFADDGDCDDDNDVGYRVGVGDDDADVGFHCAFTPGDGDGFSMLLHVMIMPTEMLRYGGMFVDGDDDGVARDGYGRVDADDARIC